MLCNSLGLHLRSLLFSVIVQAYSLPTIYLSTSQTLMDGVRFIFFCMMETKTRMPNRQPSHANPVGGPFLFSVCRSSEPHALVLEANHGPFL